MPAKDVKAYVKRNKNDAADAEAICEAVGRPRMRFVRAKSAEQQGRLMQHRARDLLLRTTTVQGGGHCARQQDGARRLGTAGQGWHLSSACARGSIRRGYPMGK